MEILFSHKFSLTGWWYWATMGKFSLSNQGVKYCLLDRDIWVLTEDGQMLTVPRNPFQVRMSSRWRLIHSDSRPYLVFDETCGLDINTLCMHSPLPESVHEQYLQELLPWGYYEKATFDYGPYHIERKGEWGYRCLKDGECIWEFTGRPWLYTKIKCRGNHLYFGTSGNGGNFYILDLATGELLFREKTGGTEYLVENGPYIYILRNAPKAQLLKVNLDTVRIEEIVDLPGKAAAGGAIELIEGNIHAITEVYNRKGILEEIYWNCVKADYA